MTSLNIDIQKVKDRLFVFADCKDQQQNIALSLIVNPQIIKILLDQLLHSPKPKKIQLLHQLGLLFKNNPNNSLILAKRDAEIEDHNISILDDLISFILTINAEGDEIPMLGELFLSFIRLYPVNSKNIRKITTYLSKLFYQGDFSSNKMSLSILVLRLLFESQTAHRNQPSNYFFFYGENSGIRMIHDKALWMFSKGFTLNISFSPLANQKKSSLFAIRVKDSQFELSLSEDLTLCAKVFGDTEQIQLLKLHPNKWYYLRLQYLLKSRLFNKVFVMKITIDGRTFQKQNLSVPQINQNDVLDEIIFGEDFYGRINSIFLSREQDFNQNFEIQPPFWTTNWQELEGKFKANKKLFESLYLVYVPYISTTCGNKNIIYDISSRNHGQLLQNSTIYKQNFVTKDINYFGGLYNLLPLFELLKYFDPRQYPHMLEDILELFLSIFKTRIRGIQQETVNCRLFSIMGAQLPEINQEFITKHSLKLLFSIKEELKEVVLKEQFFRDLIWKFNIKNIINIEVIKELTKLISIMYQLNTSFYLNVYGIQNIMHYIIQQFQPIDINRCCVNHYLHSNIPTNIINLNHPDQQAPEPLDLEYFFQNYTQGRSHPFVILIIELVNHLFETKEQLGVEALQVLMMFSVSNHSMCFMKFVLDILEGVVMSEKVNKKQLIENNLLGYIFIILERNYHHQIVTQVITLLKAIIGWEESSLHYHKILFAIVSCLKRYPREVEVKSSNISEVYSPEEGLKRRDSSSSDRQQLQHLASILKLRKVNYSNYKPLLDIVLSLVIDQNSLTINDQAIQVLNVYYQIANSNFKRMAIKHIFCQIYEASAEIKESMRVEFYFLFKFLLKTLIETKLAANNKPFQDEIEKLVIESLASLIIPVLFDRPKIYWYLIKLEALMIIIIRELCEFYNEDFVRLTINYELRLLFKKILDREECVLGKGLQNIIFYLYGVMFCSQEKQEPVRLLSYFKILEKELWLEDFNRLPQSLKQPRRGEWLVFIDADLISIILNKLPLQQFSIHTNHINKVSRLLDPKMSPELKQLKNGLLQQIAQMKSKSPKNQSFFDFFQTLLQSSLIQQKQTPQMKSIKTLSNKNVCLIEVVILMVEISVEYYLKHQKYEKFTEMLELSERIILGYMFSMINSGQSTKNVKIEENQLMKKVLLTWFHFHYNVMDNEQDIKFNEKIEETLVEVFQIICLVVSLLGEKIGSLETLSDCLHYGGIMQNMEGTNLYILQFLDQHVLTAKRKPLITLSSVKQFLNMNHESRLNLVLSQVYKDVFKRSGYMLKLLQYEVVRQIFEVKAWYRNKLNEEVMACNLGMAVENYNQELVKEREELMAQQEDEYKKSEIEFMKQTNSIYRTSMYSWGKIWKRLRKYHYPWSDWVNQRESREWRWEGKEKKLEYFKNKLSNSNANDGSRPILEVKLQDPWHVRKRAIERQIQYMAKDYHYNFYKKQSENKHENKPRNFLLKLFNRNNVAEGDEFNVEWILNNEKRKGSLKILPEKLQFLFTSIYQKDSHVDFTHFRLGEFKPLVKLWDLVLITNAIRRRYLTYDQCLLIELENNTSLIFNFTDRNLDDFLSLLSKKQKSKIDQKVFLKLNNIRFYTEKFDYELSEHELIKAKTEEWSGRKISNFQYLLALNRFGGRSFYDPTQYPVMPWVVSNYSSEEITMRPLDKTMGALGSQSRRLALCEKSKLLDPFNPVPPYQYGTHYSSPGVVFNFMIRMSPYTEAGRTLQGGKFDIADRVFFSLNWAWRSATTEMSDVRELLPQFYYLPEFLLNLEYYDFGLTQTKQRVHNVELPPWCNNDPYQFIAKHRQILEGESVSMSIHSWIDLIFGYKQKGKEAEQSLNLYYYLTYQNAIDIESIQDEVNKTSVEAQVVHFGQTPHQLFQKPHRKRQPYMKRISISLSNQYKVYNPKRTVKQSWENIGEYSKGNEPILNISWNKLTNNIVILKCNNILQYSFFEEEFDFVSEHQLNLKKTKNEIHLMDLNFENKVAMFASKYIVTGFSLNGELRVYSTEGKLIETQYGEVKNCVYVNTRQNLLMTGGKDGLFQVYEIIYQDQNQLSLISIASQQCYYSISHISEGSGFYAVCSGNIVSIYNINRSAVFVDKKLKKVRCKFIRSFTARRKIACAQIVSSPLFSIVFYDNTQLWSYSINGQMIANRPMVLGLNPLIFSNQNHMEFVLCLEESQLMMLSTPNLATIKVLDLPQKEFTCWTLYQNHILIGASNGELIVVNKAFLVN